VKTLWVVLFLALIASVAAQEATTAHPPSVTAKECRSSGGAEGPSRTPNSPFSLDILLALSIMPESVFESVDPAGDWAGGGSHERS